MNLIAIQIDEYSPEVQSGKKALWDGQNFESNLYEENLQMKASLSQTISVFKIQSFPGLDISLWLTSILGQCKG